MCAVCFLCLCVCVQRLTLKCVATHLPYPTRDACLKLIDPFFVLSPPTEVSNSTSCLVGWSDPTWASDPCCNPALQVYQCWSVDSL